MDSKDAGEKEALAAKTAPNHASIFIQEVQGHNKRLKKIIDFTHSSTIAAGVMLVAAIVAIIVANTPASEGFLEFWEMHAFVGVGGAHIEMSLEHIINDIFMALFFLLVGLEIKYEMTVGELTNIRQAALPILGACGGVLMPIVIYLIFNISDPNTSHGWGVPTATDIAFALGILALLGDRIPNGIRVFLSTLAVADDIIAILVIAIFYGESPSFLWLAIAALVMVCLVVMNKCHIYGLAPYILVGAVLWFCVFMSGVHSTIAGVLLAFTIPSGSRVDMQNFLKWSDEKVQQAVIDHDDNVPIIAQKKYLSTVDKLSHVSKQVIPPATRLEHALYPWVYFLILPLFALTNAGVTLAGGEIMTMLSSNVVHGVSLGLLLGKPIGIMLFSFLTVKLKIATLPDHVTWIHMLGASILGGVGFTMAIFVANLAYTDPFLVSEAKFGILLASFIAGVIGFVFLLLEAKAAKRKGISFITTNPKEGNVTTDDIEAAERADAVIAELADADLARELDQERRDSDGTRVIKIERDDLKDEDSED